MDLKGRAAMCALFVGARKLGGLVGSISHLTPPGNAGTGLVTFRVRGQYADRAKQNEGVWE